jgi:hypothetical protein
MEMLKTILDNDLVKTDLIYQNVNLEPNSDIND